MFSKSCEYGIRAVLFIAAKSYKDNRTGIKDIAKEINSPEAFTAKILQALVKHQIVNSAKGPSGGFSINKESIRNIKLAQIVSAIDGDSIFKGCALGLSTCSETSPCPLHNRFKHIREELKQMLISTSLEDLILDITAGKTFLKLENSI